MELYCGGKPLDTNPGKFGVLRESNEIRADVDALKRRMDEEGYLFFRDLLDRDEVLDARREIMLKYAIIGEIDSINHPVIEGIRQEKSFSDQVNLLAFTESVRTGRAYENVVLNRKLIAFYEAFLGGKVRCFDFKWPRFVRPGEGCGVHADVVYVGRGTHNLWSTWIPLGDVPREEGALIILENSHKSDKLQNYWNKDADRDRIGWLSTDPVKLQQALGGRWLTTDFRAGDVICFNIRLVHAALDNCSPVNRCRLTSDTRYQLASEVLDERWNGDISNPHGGGPKAFMPGLIKVNNNREFEEEWKPVDRYGRLAMEEDAEMTVTTTVTTEDIIDYIRNHRAFSHPIFEHWAAVRPDVTTLGALFHQIQNFCASTRPGLRLPDALAAHGMDRQSQLIQEIVDSEENHGPELATMAGYLLNKTAGRQICPDLYDQQAVEAKLRQHSDQLLSSLPGYDPRTGLAVQTRQAISVFDDRRKTDRESVIRNLGVAIALEMVSNGHLIPGEKHCLVDSGMYGVSIDEPAMHYLLEHYGEIGAEQQHEKNAIAAVQEILNDETAPLIMEGVRKFLDSLVGFWDFLDSALLQSGYVQEQAVAA